MTLREPVEIVDVAPRDGFQAISTWIPTETKTRTVHNLLAAGVRRVEVGAFVSPKAIPQMADTAEVHLAVEREAGVRLSTLVPNQQGAENAFGAGITDLVYVLSVSESHNQSNVRRPVQASLDELRQVIVRGRDQAGFKLRANIATAFDCPYEGRIEIDAVSRIIEPIAMAGIPVEFGICDTTGRAFPDQVAALFEHCLENFASSELNWCFHGHDTYGLGIANALYAYEAGVRVFDAAAAGLGGCPFAPGASGNTATEDLVFTFHNMGIDTGIDLEKLMDAATEVATISGADTGGHVRQLPRVRIV